MEYLSLICNLAAVFAGFTALVSVLGTDDETGVDELALNKVRLRQMLEICLFTIAAGLMPQLLLTYDYPSDVALRISGMIIAPCGAVLLFIQGKRVFNPSIRRLSGYGVNFTRFAISSGSIVVGLFALAGFGVRPAASYATAVTLGLAIAGLQFFRTSTSVLRLPSTSPFKQ